jgi:excisionase family DNA binding protein
VANDDDRIADPVPQAAARLSVSRSMLYLELKAGRIKAVKARNRTLITREEQQRWLASLPEAELATEAAR